MIVSVGRRPYADLLGLEQTKVAVVGPEGFRRGRRVVPHDRARRLRPRRPDQHGRSSPHVGYRREAFVSVIRDILGEEPMPVNYDRVPWAIYCHPEVAWAGPGEDASKAAGVDVIVSKHHFAGEQPGDDRRRDRRPRQGDRQEEPLTGTARPDPRCAHMMGPRVTEQLSGGYPCRQLGGDRVQDTIDFVMPHPSLPELFGESVMALTGRSINASRPP